MNIIEMFSLRKLYNNTTSFVFNLFHNNGLLNLIDLCDKHGYKLILESVISVYLLDQFNSKYAVGTFGNNLRTDILNNFGNLETYSNETFKDKFYQYVRNHQFVLSSYEIHPFLFTMLSIVTSKYYINGFVEEKVVTRLDKLREDMINNKYLMEEDNDKLYNEMSLTSKNRRILLFMKNIIIDYIVSLLETVLSDRNINGLERLDDLNTNKLFLSFNEGLNRLNKEIEESIELYNKERNE